MIEQFFNFSAEHVIFTEITNNEANAEIETQPLTAEVKKVVKVDLSPAYFFMSFTH